MSSLAIGRDWTFIRCLQFRPFVFAKIRGKIKALMASTNISGVFPLEDQSFSRDA